MADEHLELVQNPSLLLKVDFSLHYLFEVTQKIEFWSFAGKKTSKSWNGKIRRFSVFIVHLIL